MRANLVLKFALRDWRAGELRLLVSALLLAVGTVSGISLFVDRLSSALLSESATYLAADRVIASTQPTPDAFAEMAAGLGLATARTMTFPSMVFAADRNQLVAVKAVSDGYPLRGVISLAAAPFGPGTVVHELPAPGSVWLDSRLFPALHVAVGDTITVGVADLRIAGVLRDEPDRGGSFADFGPRLLMRIDDVPRTEVVKPGSRIFYRLLIAGPKDRLAELHRQIKAELGASFRWMSIREASPSIGAALGRTQSFMLLGGLLAVLLAGVAVALAAHRYARRHYDHVAILKTLGATPTEIQWGYLGLLALVGAIASAAGLALGVALHLGILSVLSAYLPVYLPPPGIKPLLVGAVSGFVCLAAFGLPPLLSLRSISPMRVMRRDLEHAGVSRWLTYACAALGGLALLIWYTNNWRLTLWTLVGVVGVSAAFSVGALVLLRAGRRLGMQAGNIWRLALAGLARRRDENVAQILIFGLAIMLLLILILLRTALLQEWRTVMPEHAPNHFLMNVAPEQIQPLEALVRGHVEHMDELYPMTRGRIVAVNGVASKRWQAQRSRDNTDPNIDSERNLSWTATLPANNRIEAGAWWPPEGSPPSVSLEEQYADAAGVKVGAVLEFDVGGLSVTARVASIRRVEWNSMAPNFFILFSPGALQGLAVTYMSSFYLPPEQKPFLNELLAAFPTITVIEVDRVIEQIQSIMTRVTQAVELVLGLVLGAGCLVLVASIQASSDERLGEHALLRTLGASSRLIRGALGAEFALLGCFGGLLAAFGAEATVYVLDKHVFELPAHLHGWVWLVGPAVGAAIVAGIGLLGTRTLIASPPMLVLRGIG